MGLNWSQQFHTALLSKTLPISVSPITMRLTHVGNRKQNSSIGFLNTTTPGKSLIQYVHCVFYIFHFLTENGVCNLRTLREKPAHTHLLLFLEDSVDLTILLKPGENATSVSGLENQFLHLSIKNI